MSWGLSPNLALRSAIPNTMQWQGNDPGAGGGAGPITDPLATSIMASLVAYWPLDETNDGPAIDAHGTHDGAPQGAGFIGEFTPGKLYATARHLVEPNVQRFAVPDHAQLDFTTQFTATGWIRMDDAVAQMAMMGKWVFAGGGTLNSSWAFQTSPAVTGSGAFRVFIASGTDPGNNFADYDTFALTNDTWTMATLVYDGTQAEANRVKVYVNTSVPTPSNKGGTWAASIQNSTADVKIGDFENLGREWNGQLQGWMLANRAFTAAEVAYLYNGGFGQVYPFSAPAIPTFVAAGTGTGGVGNITPQLPIGLAQGDLMLMFIESANQPGPVPPGYAALAADGMNVAGAADATGLEVFWKIAGASESTVSVTDRGDHTYGVILAFRGCDPTQPWDVFDTVTDQVTGPGGSTEVVVTTIPNTLIVSAVAHQFDTTTPQFSNWVGAATTVTERFNGGTANNNGGGIGIVTAPRLVAGSSGTVNFDLLTSFYTSVTIALRGASSS